MTTDQIYFMITSALMAASGSLVLIIFKIVYDWLRKIQKEIDTKVDNDLCEERRKYLERERGDKNEDN